MRVLLVGNDVSFMSQLKKRLIANGDQVRAISSHLKGLGLMKVDKYNVVVTEYKTGELNGLEFAGAASFLEKPPRIIYILSADEKKSIAKICNLGFNDYVEKPANINELVEKINVAASTTSASSDIYRCGELVLDLSDRSVKRGDKNIKLSFKEFELLLLLVKNKNKVVSRDLIANALYDWNEYIESNAIDVYIRYLRIKIDEGFENKMIQTIRRIGYIIKE